MPVVIPFRRLAVLLATACAILVGRPALAQKAPSADEVVRQMKAALEPPKPSIRTMTMTLDDRGTKSTFGLVQARKRLADGDRALTVLLEPEGARGIAYLTADSGSGATEWLYVPYVQRTRKLVPAENYQSFMDTDFTYGDLGLLPVDTRNNLLGTETIDDKKAYKVESIPSTSVKQWYYSRTVTWIDASTLLPLRREFFSPAGDLFKVETFGSVTRIDGVPTPLEMRITDVGTGSTTTLTVNSVSYEANVPDSLFQPDGLRTIADADAWKAKAKPTP
ncbi:outer membrane lipoprotein-sorting protein [Candidatus Binatia bacterium]|jgi:outer membrane lipoprotein-sorting protein|nr:outer membrane lipoprotein-sorting protein [Candidatus Binatia bacterium]